jgi:DNA-binding NarL/FixJ family response regulator
MRQVLAERLPSRVILLTAYDDREQVVHAMRGGASAYCAKDIRPGELVRVIRQAAAGQFMVGEQAFDRAELERWLAQHTESAMRSYGDPGEPHYPLSGTRDGSARHTSRGASATRRSPVMGISHQTVKNHVTSLLRKLGVEDRTQAAIYALQRGWVRLDGPESETQESML